MYNNQVESINNLGSLQKLEYVGLARNNIREIKYFDIPGNLTNLDLSDNKISRVENLKGLRKIKYISLDGNPFFQSQDWRDFINHKI